MRTIAIVAGGDSSEFDVSVKSAAGVEKNLSPGYKTYIINIKGPNWYWEDKKGRYHNIDKNGFTLDSGDQKIRFDAVFIAIHGKPGENGMLQGYFDMLGIPYTSCSSFCSAITFNKHATKLYLKEYGITAANAILFRNDCSQNPSEVIARVGLPCFVKPNDSGSSFGVTKVKKTEDFPAAMQNAFSESNEVLVESFVNGREVACGVVKTKKRSLVFPVTEIISKNEFFDYEAKYTAGMSDEVTPANMPAKIIHEIQRLSSEIYDILGCKGIVRVDFIISDDKPYFIEINTVPGMTEESIVPKQAAAAGLSLDELYSMVIEDLF